MKQLTYLLPLCFLCGCYSNWPDLDKVTNTLSCDMSVTDLEKVSKRYGALGSYDDVSKT